MSLEHAMLGLLSIKPQTGYDIKKYFDNSINFVWNSDQTRIYRTLSEMIEKKLVSLTVVRQDGKPNKKVYKITDTGLIQLKCWLLKPLKQKNQMNQELLQFFFLGQLSTEEILNNLKRMKQSIELSYAALSSIEQNSEYFNLNDKTPRIHYFFRKSLELGIMDSKINLDWITGVIREIEQENFEQIKKKGNNIKII